MNSADTKELLEAVAAGQTSVEDALAKLRVAPVEDLGYAQVDHHRALRHGVGEVVYGEGKTPQQIAGIMGALRKGGQQVVLATRVDAAKAAEVRVLLTADAELADGCDSAAAVDPAAGIDPAVVDPAELFYHEAARILQLGAAPEPDGNGPVVIVCAGTSDLPVAEEAAVTAAALGNQVERLYDVGVAGIHRLLNHADDLANAQVVIAVAGMEGALASVVGGLAACPVIAVPTSVGYGASFGGVSALLSMLNSCASNVSVVNIDNGFGAAYQASIINHLLGKRPTGVEGFLGHHSASHGHSHAHGASEPAPVPVAAPAASAAAVAPAASAAAVAPAASAAAAAAPAAVAAPAFEPKNPIHFDFTEDARRSSILWQLREAIPELTIVDISLKMGTLCIPNRHHHDLGEVLETIEGLEVSDRVKRDMQGVYVLLAQAEATVHQMPVEQTHFHEVGRAEGIRNVALICMAMEAGGFDYVTATPIQVGSGTVECAHGTLEVPAPATRALLEGMPVCEERLEGELCTPTSAAMIKYFVNEFVTE